MPSAMQQETTEKKRLPIFHKVWAASAGAGGGAAVGLIALAQPLANVSCALMFPAADPMVSPVSCAMHGDFETIYTILIAAIGAGLFGFVKSESPKIMKQALTGE